MKPIQNGKNGYKNGGQNVLLHAKQESADVSILGTPQKFRQNHDFRRLWPRLRYMKNEKVDQEQ